MAKQENKEVVEQQEVEQQEVEQQQAQAQQQEVKESVEQPEAEKPKTEKAEKPKSEKVYKLKLNAAHLRYIEGVRFLPGQVTEVTAEQFDKIKANAATAKLFQNKVLEEK